MKKLTTGVLLAGAAILGGTAASQPASAADVTLKFANWLPPFHHWTTTARDFADSIDANAVHGSDSTASAQREIAYFFSDDEIFSR